MDFQDSLAEKLDQIQNLSVFIRTWVLQTKSPDWLAVDANYTLAKAQYMKMRQRIIDLTTALPSV